MLRTWQISLEENRLVQYVAACLCSIQSLIAGAMSSSANNKYCVGLIVIILGSVYPLILKYTKNGQEKYPFMIGVAVCVKNIFMLCYYLGRYLLYLYNQYTHKVYNWNDHSSLSPGGLTQRGSRVDLLDESASSDHDAILSSPTVSASKAPTNMFGSTPSKLAWALNVLQSSSLHKKQRRRPK